jgi:hypothetical protein
MLVVSTEGELLTCGGFSLGETIHFGSLEFIADYFTHLSLPSKGSDSGAVFMGTTRSGPTVAGDAMAGPTLSHPTPSRR